MPTFQEKYGPWAIVAGGATGLGEAYSVSLAKRKMNLLLVDNQLDDLNALAKRLRIEYGIDIKPLHTDLSHTDAERQIINAIDKLDAGLLIYNAAFSRVKPFIRHTGDELDSFIRVNAGTQLRLVHSFASRLIMKNRPGGILLMSSLAGLIGMQMVTPYAATKAFSWNLAEALHFELRPEHIDVLACVAGATATPAYLNTHPKYGLLKPQVMRPEDVAEKALRQLGKKALFMPGMSNRINYFILTRLLPRKLAASIANKTMERMYSHLK